MKVLTTALPDVVLIEPALFEDARGSFMETWNQRRYVKAGVPADFQQDNLSRSRRGVLRGLHFQNPNAQGKLVFVLKGEVFDVAVDIRLGSPTYGHWAGEILSADNRRQLYIPTGYAHGFCVTSEEALVAYKCTAPYDAAAEGAIRWDDPDIGIEWPELTYVVSEKDRAAPFLRDMGEGRLPVYR